MPTTAAAPTTIPMAASEPYGVVKPSGPAKTRSRATNKGPNEFRALPTAVDQGINGRTGAKLTLLAICARSVIVSLLPVHAGAIVFVLVVFVF